MVHLRIVTRSFNSAGGDENFHIWAQPIADGKPARDLTPFDGVRAQNMMTDKNHPEEILVGLNKRNPQVCLKHYLTTTTT